MTDHINVNTLNFCVHGRDSSNYIFYWCAFYALKTGEMDEDMDDELHRILMESDDTCMPLPTVHTKPHTLIAKVRKQYFDYVLRLLSINYETTKKIPGRKISLPTAIWRCAKQIEMNAAAMCMVVDLYRDNIITVVNELKAATKKGQLHKKLYDYLHRRPENEKSTQSNINFCCVGHKKYLNAEYKKSKKHNGVNLKKYKDAHILKNSFNNEHLDSFETPVIKPQEQFKIPVIVNQISNTPETVMYDRSDNNNVIYEIDTETIKINDSACIQPNKSSQLNNNDLINEIDTYTNKINDSACIQPNKTSQLNNNDLIYEIDTETNKINDSVCTQPNKASQLNEISQTNNTKTSVELQVSVVDEVILELEKIFGIEAEDDVFEGLFIDSPIVEQTEPVVKEIKNIKAVQQPDSTNITFYLHQDSEKFTPLFEQLALLDTPTKNKAEKSSIKKHKKKIISTELCESYYTRYNLQQKLDRLCETRRKKYHQVKEKFQDLFGEDSDEDRVMSPPEETPEFIASCKARIGPLIVRYLHPYYSRGRVANKPVFKSLVKHLIMLIYECNQYPSEKEIKSFVDDFVRSRNSIRCESDFKRQY